VSVKRPSDSAVLKATGMSWQEWYSFLDGQNLQKVEHKTIVAAIRETEKANRWWQQEITIHYERARGLRDRHQRSDGHYEISRQRKFPVPAEKLAEFLLEGRRRKWWIDVKLPDPQQKTISGNSTFIFPWTDEKSTVLMVVEAVSEESATLTIVHRDLDGLVECDDMKAYWAQNVEILKQLLTQ